MPGAFITFEGIEGSGKSTQISRLLSYLTEQRLKVTLTREPGGTPIGDQLRKVLLDPANRLLDPTAELLLYAAGRAQHLREVIQPALAEGRIVLCDRFSDATIAYQGYGRGLPVQVIRELDRIVTSGLRPKLTVLLDLPAEAGLGRARGRNTDQGLHGEARFENEGLAFHNRVRNGYLQLAREEPDRIRIVDASRNPDEIQMDVRRVADEVLRTSK